MRWAGQLGTSAIWQGHFLNIFGFTQFAHAALLTDRARGCGETSRLSGIKHNIVYCIYNYIYSGKPNVISHPNHDWGSFYIIPNSGLPFFPINKPQLGVNHGEPFNPQEIPSTFKQRWWYNHLYLELEPQVKHSKTIWMSSNSLAKFTTLAPSFQSGRSEVIIIKNSSQIK